ncbi:hypothetical protein EC960427_4141B, partial [Escherichia coli 96.0427]
INRLNYKNQ